MAIRHRQDPRLHRGQPHRERPAVVLDENAQETLHRTQKGPVHHVGPVRSVVLTHEGDPESLRHVEVELDGGALPGSAQGVFHFDIDLWPVERRRRPGSTS